MRACPGAAFGYAQKRRQRTIPPSCDTGIEPSDRRAEGGTNAGVGEREWGDQDYTIECSGRITLECGCGERLVLIGLDEDWRSKQRTDFHCPCDKGLTLSNRLREDVFEFGRLMRGTFEVPS